MADHAATQASDAPHAAGEGDHHVVRHEVNDALVTILPWGISIVFHLGLILMTIFVAWTTIAATGEDEVIIPVIKLSATPGAPLQMRQTEQRVTQSTTERRAIQRVPTQSPQQTEKAGPLAGKVEVKTQLIGGSGALSSGKAAPFGTAIDAGGAQFKANFFGSGGGNVKRLVLIVDATGSLMAEFPFVLAELKRTVNDLNERQSFTIIFFTGEKVIEVPPAGLKFADPQTKANVIKWIDPEARNVTPVGKNPVAAVEAIRAALRYKPDLMFLLSDNIAGTGQYELNTKTLLDEIKRANTSKTKINTIQFIEEDPSIRYGQKATLELIAEQSGGTYRFVPATELFLR